MKIGMLTGSFDPITIGHIALLERALPDFDKVYLALLVNPDKRYAFALPDRIEMAKAAVADKSDVEVVYSSGMTVDLAKRLGVNLLIRGVRDDKDRAYEEEMAAFNRDLGVDTVIYPADNLVSSTHCRELLDRGDYSELPPPCVPLVKRLLQK